MTKNDTADFYPRAWARSAHLQTIFASLKFRLKGRSEIAEQAREVILDGFDGSRLLGYLSRVESGKSRGLVLLIHGWEGSSESTYILSTGNFLLKQGYDIFRLNLRDHGASHHLNKGLFHGALIEETHNAVIKAAGLSQGKPFFVIGFSLGANFALRVALRHSMAAVPNLRHVFAISPALDPYEATVSIDRSIYRLYFLKKWKRSLSIKQRLFPEIYDFAGLLKMRSCMEMTEAIMPIYSSFADYRQYFNKYTLHRSWFSGLAVPVTAIASEDDPVIPVRDLKELEGSPNMEISIQRYGGHCGFLDPFPYGCWYERRICAILNKY